jgi:hypothetical protein
VDPAGADRTRMKETLEIKISDDSDWKMFEQICGFISKDLLGSLVNKLDGLDQRYWDFEINGKYLTLHLEHYLGISLLSSEFGDKQSADYRDLIEIRTKYFRNSSYVSAFVIPSNSLEVIYWNKLWGFIKDNQFFSFSEVHDCLYALPLLETEPTKVTTLIRDTCERMSTTEDSFPIRNIVLKALKESEYYYKIGVSWIESGFPYDQGILTQIESRINDKKLSQDTRHRSRQLLKNLHLTSRST